MPSPTGGHGPASSPERLASAARACPALTDARKLAEWVGRGRPLTTRGVLKPAAAVEACDVLGIELRTRKPRSALDIDELMMVWAVSAVTGFVEVGRDLATAGAILGIWTDGTADDVLAVWIRSVVECFGLAGESEPPDPAILAVLVVLHEMDGAISPDDLAAGIADVIGDVPSGLTDDLDALTDIDGDAIVDSLREFGIAELRGDRAELTPLGRWFTDVLFRQSAPAADADAATLVGTVADLPNRIALLMARPWLSARTPEAAARELIAATESASGQDRLAALTLARECGPDAAPAWRERAAEDGFGAYARVWLAEQDGVEPTKTDMAWVTVDALDTLLDSLPPDLPPQLLSSLLQERAGARLPEALPLLADCGHPATSRLVALLAGQPVAAVRPDTRYQIKVTLLGATKPPVWRRLEVPADLDLGQLHDLVQAAMGWLDCHLHVFSDGDTEYGVPDPELGFVDERMVRLSQLLAGVGDQLRYAYDFGDGWEHDITLEKILPADAGKAGAICTAGKGACPPEDCGGVWGYQELKATLADPNADRHESMLEWLGLDSPGDFDPNRFSTEDVNRRLHGSGRRQLGGVR